MFFNELPKEWVMTEKRKQQLSSRQDFTFGSPNEDQRVMLKLFTAEPIHFLTLKSHFRSARTHD
jgi:hypothetical protein